MKDELDFSMFDDENEEVKNQTEDDALDLSMFDDEDELSESIIPAMEELPPQEDGEMGKAEAAVTGMGQGASFGLTPIIAGMTGVAGEVAEDTADLLGIGEEPELEGFNVKDEYEGVQGLMDAYYAQRDRQRAQESQAFEDQPAATIGGNIVGGIASTIASAPLTKGGGLLAKILPKAESVKDLTNIQRAGIAAREGAKAGGLAGFGGGEGKLLEGEIGKTIGETGATAVGGGVLGTGMSGMGSLGRGIYSSIEDTPLVKMPKLGYEAMKKFGINISNDKQITDFVRSTTSDIRDSISRNFKGASKKQLLEQADEIGIRVSAGESIDDVISNIKQTGAWNEEEQVILNSFIKDLKNLSDKIDPTLSKALQQSERGAASKLNKIYRRGGEVDTRTEFDTPFDELSPLPENQGRVIGVEDKVKIPSKTPEGKDTVKKIITQKAVLDSEVPLRQHDLENLKLSELDEIISNVGRKAYPKGEESAAVPHARDLYAKLREISNDAINDSSLPDKNKKLKNLFDALESLDIKPRDFFSGRETVKDMVENKIQQKLIASPLSTGDNKMNNFLKYLTRADEELAKKIGKQSEFASDIAKFVKASEGEGSVSIKSVAGPVQKILAKAGNIVGSGARAISKAKKDTFNGIKAFTPDKIQDLSSELSNKFGNKAMPYINQLNKAVNAPSQRKNALMYGIYQQPAFRKMLKQLGRNVIGESEVQAGDIPRSEYVTKDNYDFNDDDYTSVESKKNPEIGKEPQGTNIGRDIIEEEEEIDIYDKTIMSESGGGKYRDNRSNKADQPSVGSLQFTEDTAEAFLKNNPLYSQYFDGMEFSSDEFFNTWNNLEDSHPQFLTNTKQYLKEANLDPILNEYDIAQEDMQSFASLSTQFGPRLLKIAIDRAGASDINSVTDHLIENIDKYFKTYKSKGGDLTPIKQRLKEMQRIEEATPQPINLPISDILSGEESDIDTILAGMGNNRERF
jgi:hypothetical protein